MKMLGHYIFVCVVVQFGFAQDSPVVTTTYGDILGLSQSTQGGNSYEEFLGVPFAAPPVGDLRWRKPVAPDSWEGVRSATRLSRECTQLAEIRAREDCLYLNIYVPGAAKDLVAKNVNLPVIFFIHGGIFVGGSAIVYDGSLLATNGQVIVVTTNYRLSTLGFFSTKSDVAEGNYGLWDQIAALQWVQDNIAAFGGDASRVTLMGQSAGGASVSHLSLSPEAKGLFDKVILISGSSSSYFATTEYQSVTAKRLANQYNCPTESDAEMVECLRGESAFFLDIFGVAFPLLYDQYLLTNNPIVDGQLVTTKPIDAMRAGLNADYDLMTGAALHDAAQFALPYTSNATEVNDLVSFIYNTYKNRDELVSLSYERYPKLGSDVEEDRQRSLIKLGTDLLFACPAYKEAELHYRTSNRNTYVYEFRHQYSRTEPSWLEGTHSEDLAFIFGRDSFEGPDAQLSQYIQAYYSNFAYTGNPNEGPHAVPVEWSQFDPETNQRLVEQPDVIVETIPDVILDDYKWADYIYEIVQPRTDEDADLEHFSMDSLGMWNRMLKEIKA